MKRRWNIAIWAGFLLVVAAGAGYLPLSARWPVAADWIALSIFLAGLLVTGLGVIRAYRGRGAYRGRIAGPILMALGLTLTGFYSYGTFYVARRMPDASGAPRVGQKAPDFTLRDQEGRGVSLSGLLGGGEGSPSRGALVIFYRGYW